MFLAAEQSRHIDDRLFPLGGVAVDWSTPHVERAFIPRRQPSLLVGEPKLQFELCHFVVRPTDPPRTSLSGSFPRVSEF